MGNASSTNVANITSNILSKEISNEISQTSLKSGQSQMISVVGGTGSVTMDGNTQNLKLSVNMDAVAKQLSTQKSQQSIVQQLSQAAASSTKGLNLFNSSNSDNTMNDVLNASMTVASNLDQICAAKGNQNQTIQVDQRDGNIQLNDNTQTAMASVVSKCIQNAAATNTSLQQASQELAETASAKTVGLSLAQLALLLLALALVMGLPVVIALVGGSTAGIKIITALMGPIFIAIGIVCIWWWTKHKGKDTKTMTGIQFSTLISNDPTCGAIPYQPVASPGFAPSDSPLNTAGALCLSDPNCKAFDWDASTKPPQATFYKSISSVPCPNVTTQTLEKAGIDLVSDAAFFQGTGPPSASAPVPSTMGDVYIDSNTGRIYWKIETDKTKNPWVDVTDGQSFPGWTSGAAFAIGTESDPEDSMGKDNDLYINTSDPNAWEVWKRYNGKYTPLNSSDAGNLTVGTNGGTVLEVSYAKKNLLSFPGRHGNTQPASDYNWSAYVVDQNTTTYFWLIMGILCLCGGVAILLIKLYQMKNAPAKPTAMPTPTITTK